MANRVDTAAFMLVAGLAGCTSNGSSTPTAPTVVEPPPTAQGPIWGVAEATLSGKIYETTPAGRIPIEGVRVFLSDDYDTATDSEGAFSLNPVWVCGPCPFSAPAGGRTALAWIGKEGYVDAPGRQAVAGRPGSGYYVVTISGDTRFDVELVRR